MSNPLRILEFVAPGLQVIALELGYFDDEDLEVDITKTRSSVEQRQALQSGSVDVGLTAIDNLIPWNADGDDLRVFCQVERITVADFIVGPEIEGFSDLRGKVVAVDAPTTGFAIVVRQILARHGLEEGAYSLLAAGGPPARFDALVSGEAQAGLIGPPLNGPAVERGLRKLTTPEAEFPTLPGLVAVASAKRISDLRPVLGRYVRALERAANWVGDDTREQALEFLARAGFEGDGGDELLAVVPSSVVPSYVGAELTFSMRESLGLLPAAPSRPDDILDFSVVEESLG